MDDEKRRLYDETGEIDDGFDVKLENTYDYYRHIYPTINEKDIEDFSEKYRNSEMEEEDLIEYYEEYKGDMTNILEFIPLSTNDDIKRFIKFYDKCIKDKKIKKLKNFTRTKKNIKLLESDDEEQVAREKEKIDKLASAIMLKNSERKNNLADKISNFYYYNIQGKNSVREKKCMMILMRKNLKKFNKNLLRKNKYNSRVIGV